MWSCNNVHCAWQLVSLLRQTVVLRQQWTKLLNRSPLPPRGLLRYSSRRICPAFVPWVACPASGPGGRGCKGLWLALPLFLRALSRCKHTMSLLKRSASQFEVPIPCSSAGHLAPDYVQKKREHRRCEVKVKKGNQGEKRESRWKNRESRTFSNSSRAWSYSSN